MRSNKLLYVFVSVLAFALISACTKKVDDAPKSTTAQPEEVAPLYTGTAYVSGMGGHIAMAGISINPANRVNPLRVDSLDMIVLGSKQTHPTHDVRIDQSDRNKMYFSTYRPDETLPGKLVHYGTIDLGAGSVTMDRTISVDGRAKLNHDIYCASGQTESSYIPITMSDEAYIDVFDKATLDHKKRVFLDYKFKEAKFYHGTNSPDMSKFMLVINRADDGKPNGNIDLMMLDAQKLQEGKVEVLAKAVLTGSPGKTLTFRQSFTPDGKYILQSGNDRFYLIEAENLKLVDEEFMEFGGSHGAFSTPDSKYAVLTLRSKNKDNIIDGVLLLYDIEGREVIGNPVSVCHSCHKDAGVTGSVSLCGGDVNWKE